MKRQMAMTDENTPKREEECRNLSEAFLKGSSDDDVLPGVEYIGRFRFHIQLQPHFGFLHEDVRELLIDRLLKQINEVLDVSELFGLQNLRAEFNEESRAFRFAFVHDRYHFEIILQNDKFEIVRESSSMQQFVIWYYMLMPHVSQLFASISDEISNIAKEEVTPTQSGFVFKFYLTGFQLGVKKSGRNIDVISNALGSLPSTKMGEAKDSSFEDFYRIDLTLGKREKIRGKQRSCWYSLEAPFNHTGRYLEAQFELRSADLEIMDERGNVRYTLPYDPRSIGEYAEALEDFLRDRAMETFLNNVMAGGWQFRTERMI